MGGRFDCKVSAKDTGGNLCIYDTYRNEKGGPAVHLHYHQDEWFFVIAGEFVVKVGDDLMQLKAGDSALAPRQIPHTFAKISDSRAHMMILFAPLHLCHTDFTSPPSIRSAEPVSHFAPGDKRNAISSAISSG